MIALTPLEQTALLAILDEMANDRDIVEKQLLHAKVISRENTGGGFFTDLAVASGSSRLEPNTPSLGQNIWMGIDGLEYGLGMILHHKNGRVNLLEGYAVGPKDTSPIDFTQVRFAIAQEPGPLRDVN